MTFPIAEVAGLCFALAKLSFGLLTAVHFAVNPPYEKTLIARLAWPAVVLFAIAGALALHALTKAPT